ncbi:non-ribosomal peptide synthase/polyketide synthase [Bacillus atrophaeus]|uniref:non-ribosomal peptide synthase/polyketide synthase n=1 Tax=Bacillus atrophaeus TaxID=1452 RepID=UPI002E1C424D|nr:non-ribosomal peptide synthase/polyketide synthase [Bacillus atrophaeus]MED1031598.1 non-ribosomal peptide synthase/polyketide synthase [Bacillus atrophaeus]MED1120756.1 non-ribosomal peptide synthase/polyketide synthase [Bacillus atrophaeus]MED1133775.1 non-ribosomal peptide synthase/polyketide synthase [Bacillus atrophaeus]
MSVFKNQETYWDNLFDEEDGLSVFPSFKAAEKASLARTGYQEKCIYRSLSPEVSQRIMTMANHSEMAAYLILMAGIECLLYKYTDRTNVILGIPTVSKQKSSSAVNTIVLLKNTLSSQSTFKTVFEQLKEAVNDSLKNQNLPFRKMVQHLTVQYDDERIPLIHTVVSLNEIHSLQFKEDVATDTLFHFDLENNGIHLKLFYNGKLYDERYMDQIVSHLDHLLSVILFQPQAAIHTADVIPEAEKHQMLFDFNDTNADYSGSRTAYQLFEEQAERTPDHPAVKFENSRLTYRELNEKANRLARTLRNCGVQADTLVAIMAERSLEMIVSMIAIWKAGGAYVPLDPEYPKERLQYLLNDANADVLVVQRHFKNSLVFDGPTIDLNDETSYHADCSLLSPIAEHNHLAYVIYTSGTTGKPKGVMAEHGGIVNSLQWKKAFFKHSEEDRVLVLYPYVFDAFILNFFGPLISGATLYLLPNEDNKDLFAIQNVLRQERITHFSTSPRLLKAMIEQMNEEDFLHVQHVVVGGEQLEPDTVERLFSLLPQIRLNNEYGPTENSVVSTFQPVHSADEQITIGKPVANHQAYILGAHHQIQPIGVPGELYVGGAGVARGYLNRPELTKEKFVQHLLLPGQKMYKTGDLARWLPDGRIEYLGRIDHQVKIRGYRIELGEVESAMFNLEEVREATVVAREGADGAKQLYAYYVGEPSLTAAQFRAMLSRELPDYMIPSYFIHLERIPLTPNGKIDLKALPVTEEKTRSENEYIAPRNSIEELLVSIWQEVLGADRIGILDNFFDFGGDSIKSIQVSSRLYQAGYKVDMKHLFKYPTIAELSTFVEPVSRMADQGEVKGRTSLTPIQHWFFEQKMPHAHHYNQAVMLFSAQGFKEAPLRQAMEHVAMHHDALRMIFEETPNGYVARIAGTEESELYHLEVMNCKGDADPAQAAANKASRIQSSMELSQGPLMKLGLFQCPDGDHLLIAIHHLVIDGISWRILLEDIASGYEQAVRGQTVRLPQKTDSFPFWAEQLSKYALETEMEQELAYWTELSSLELQPLPKDNISEGSLLKDSDEMTIQWTKEETEQLLKQANRAYNTDINDLLLTSLGLAVHRWTGMEEVVVNLEGHGREPVIPDADITRTVGWFTSQYPVVLKMEAGKELSQRIKTVKEGLRQIPDKGMNYSVIKYLSGRPEADSLQLNPEISFNYLGQFDQDLQHHAFQVSPYSTGLSMNENQVRTSVLDLNGMIAEGKLSLTLSYSNKQYERSTMAQFAQSLKESLQEVIAHCVSQQLTSLTPSDILLKDITIDELEQLLEQTREIGEAENIYPLTPMQKGMLFHSLFDPNSGAYFQQTTFDLHGDLDIDSFSKSLDGLSQRYDIFRTNFYRGWKDQPLQIILKTKKIGFQFIDLREMTEAQKEEMIQAYAREDKIRGFDLAKDALMRLFILRTDEKTYRFIWSFHHILMDGWCLPLITKEIFDHYFALLQQKQPEQATITPYSQYIEWLDRQDAKEAKRYWDLYLEGYEEQTVLPKDNHLAEDERYIPEKVTCEIGADLTLKMKQTASKRHVTLNTLLQTAWGVLLQKYNRSGDVVFGSVVSGRPAGIPNVETMIGLFINTIPVRIQCEDGITFAELMKQAQERAVASQKYETYPLYDIQARTTQRQNLITHLMIFENYPVGQYMESISQDNGSSIAISNVQMEEQTNYDFNVTVIPGEAMNIYFEYNAKVYDRASMERIREHFVQILHQVVADADIQVEQVELLTEGEKTHLLQTLNDTSAPYPQKAVYQLFEDQSQRTPDQAAVIDKDEQLTYRQLNERANQLARTIRAKGVQADHPVAIISRNSIESVVGILAILKAGGAYVPIDPEYPQDRIQYMLDDSQAGIVLMQRDVREQLTYKGVTVLLDEESSYHEDASNLEPLSDANHLAYVIYTSGSTGKPKGVLIEHRGLTNYIWWAKEVYVKGEKTNFPLYSSISFDLTVTSIFTPLVTGNTIIVYDGEDKTALLASIVQDPRVDIIKLTPAHLQVLKAMNIDNKTAIRKMIVGGENLSTRLAQSIHEQFEGRIEICNEYGPTETVVGCMIYRYDSVRDRRESVPIGTAAANMSIYVLDENLKPVPIGVLGEIYISGAGVARGYLNRPELTAEKFVDDPFVPGAKMYKTGDLAKWLTDGNIEYAGRIDEQVKIRGYRIELGEIEAALHQAEAIKEAVVTAREDVHGFKQLCAYYVSSQPLTVSGLREQLSHALPGYMVPAYFIELEKMPLTSNGKINRKGLPAPDLRLQDRAEYKAPRTKVEEILVSTWESVLGAENVGILDNFFDLGGDSIKSIQVSSRLNQQGYKMEIKHLFQYATIAELSPHIEQNLRVPDQGEVKGKVSLTPIQHWFFDQTTIDPHYYNQAVMLYAPQGFQESPLRQTLQKLGEHHDALRMMFRTADNGYEAWNAEIAQSELYHLEVTNLKAEADPGPAIEAKANEIQGSMRLSGGPLMKAGLFQCTDGDHLLIAIHHLIVDGVSWRILLEDIASGYRQAENGQVIQLPQKTDSFRLWAEKLSEYAQSEAIKQEQEYWTQIEQTDVKPLPKDFHETHTFSKDSETITVEWTKEETELLLKQANRAYNTEINDLLLTSLGLSISHWSGLEQIAVHLEGHGREQIIPDMDISRTVGWFTSLYPVVLHAQSGKEISYYIKTTKEGLRQIPHKGIGYGIARYLSGATPAKMSPEISFNYLGQFDQDLQHHAIQLSPYSCGADSSENQVRPYVLNINGMIAKGRLMLTISYSSKQYVRETIKRLSAFIQSGLRTIIEHCVHKEQSELTPSDILLKGMTVDELDQLLIQLPHAGEIENVYPLTPMQKGMLFHSLLDEDSSSYFEQASFDLQGALEIDRFAASLERLFEKYAVLRTRFYSGWNDVPLQIVYKTQRPKVHFADLRDMDKNRREDEIRSYQREDKAKGFDLAQDRLMRIAIFRMEDYKYHIIWSFHHIVMDGWCLPLITKEVFEHYSALQEGKEIESVYTAPYSDYMEWLDRQDHEAAKRYWSEYLEGYKGETRLLHKRPQHERKTYAYSNVICQFDHEQTKQLQQIANQHQVTLNTLIQTLWGILLQKYSGSGDVVFGSVVSGRPAEIPGVEQMIGLFINTIPVRIRCDEDSSFAETMQMVQQNALASQSYDTYPLYEIQTQTEQKQNLIDHILIFENYPIGQQVEQAGHGAAELNIVNFHIEEHTHYDFNVVVIPGEQLAVHFDFNQNEYGQSEVERIRGHFEQLMHQILQHPHSKIEEMELLTQQEKEQLLTPLSEETEQPEYETIHAMFERQAAQTPQEIAIQYEEAVISYKELNETANKLARILRKRGVKHQEPVAVIAGRSPSLAVAVLGILKAGGAFVPIDPSHPAERIRYIIENSGCAHVVTEIGQSVPEATTQLVTFIEEAETEPDGSNVQTINTAEDLLYVIYTSGTTGKPKGVLLEHRNMANLLYDQFTNSGIDFKTNVLQYASPAFDVCYQELFTALLSGGTLHIVPESIKRDPAQLFSFINKHQTDVVFFPTAFVKMLFNEEGYAHTFPRCVKHLITAGEQLTVSRLFQQVLRTHGLHLHNHYGPSETHVVSAYTIHPGDDIPEYPPIGKPICHNNMYVISKNKQLQPLGVAGELYISGANTGRGYANNPSLTGEKFLPDPFRKGAVMYRTGDLARLRADGQIEYIGRIDDQAKIRGYRIEPKEIEVILANHPAVKEAAVLIQKNTSGENELCAYCSVSKAIDPSALRTDLAKDLPDYMIPVKWAFVESIPLTVNGKVDRKALPAPEGGVQKGVEYVAPRTAAEAQLAHIWQEVLGLPRIGVKDNFFDVGGHSLRATTLTAKMHKKMGVSLPLREVFRSPTIEEMAEMITGMEHTAYTSIPTIEAKEYYAVSSAQKRQYILNQLKGGELSYNMPSVMRVEGALDRELVEKAIRKLIQRHETLRTGFELIDGEPVQRIYEDVQFAVEFTQAKEEKAEALVHGFVRAFDLEKAPLLRIGLIELAKDRHLLLFDMHHIISDGVSIRNLIEEFVSLYEGKELPPLRIQYKDYAAWQLSDMQSERMKQQEAYWLDVFSGETPVLDMPTDYGRPAVRSFEGGQIEFVIGPALTEQLKGLAVKSESTLYMVLLAAYTTMLAKYSGQEDIVVGSPIAGRTHTDLESLIGMFVGTLAIRTNPVGEKTFREYVQEVKEHTLKAYENQEYPFDELVDKLNVSRDFSRHPLFDTMFIWQNTEQGELSLEDVRFTPYPNNHAMAKFDLTFQAAEKEEGITGIISYATSLYKQETAERMAKHFIQLIEAIASDPQAPLSSLEMITAQEKEQILERWDQPAIDYPRDKTIHQLFEEQAERTPEQVAVVYEESRLTYRELNERANRLARILRSEGVQPDQPVGILAERSLEMIVGIMAILKAGGAYVPMDPDSPQERIRYILEDSGAYVLLAQRHLQERVSFAGEILLLDDERMNSGDGSNQVTVARPDHLAYVIYTSGTTGKPKGTLIEHRQVLHLIEGLRGQVYGAYDPGLHVSLLAPYYFDASVKQIFASLLGGHALFIVPKTSVSDGHALSSYYRNHRIDVTDGTPAHLQLLIAADSLHGVTIRHMLIGGEALPQATVAQLLELFASNGSMPTITNVYGPTETCVDASVFHIVPETLTSADDGGYVPIGKPLGNNRVYIVDSRDRLLPIGVKGELCIAGDGVGRGYLNLPELTGEKFVADPFVTGERMYKTGDLARYLPDGNIEYAGRKDHQVKIRGYRIELGEVEAALLNIEHVQEAVILARENAEGQSDLYAYFTGEQSLPISQLKEKLSNQIPGYMVPSYLMQLEQMPLTSNGKVNRSALPLPEAGLQTGFDYVAPRTRLEERLVHIWKEVLKLEQVGVKDNFFDLGGHSLRGMTLVAKIHKQFNKSISLREVFQRPTIEEMAKIIAGAETCGPDEIPVAEVKDVYPVSSVQKMVYLSTQIEGGELSYNMPGILTLEGRIDMNRLQSAFHRLIQRHESLRTGFEMIRGELMQVIKPQAEFSIERYKAADEEVEELFRNFVRTFDLSQAPLLRAGLIELEQDRHVFMFDMHHIVTDGASMNIFVEELIQLYDGKELAPLRIQYKDFTVWQQQAEQRERIKRQEDYWLNVFHEELPPFELPKDFARPRVRSFEGKRYNFVLDETVVQGIKQMEELTGSTAYMILLSAYNILLAKYSGQEDIVVGTPIAGRMHEDLQHIIGMFVNTLAIRTAPAGEKTFMDYVTETKETMLKAYENQEYPFEELVEKLGVKRDLSRNPLFDTMFVLQNTEQTDIEVDSLAVRPYEQTNTAAKFDLQLTFVMNPHEIQGSFDYCTKLFKQKTIATLSKDYAMILSAIIQNPSIPLKEIQLSEKVNKSEQYASEIELNF